MKRCTKCCQNKPEEEFIKDKRIKSGKESRCKECDKIKSKRVYNKRKKAHLAKCKIYSKTDKSKESNRARSKKWNKDNPAKNSARTMLYYARKIKATPKWITKEQLKEIELIYIESQKKTKETGIKHHVDHIIPLRGENVCGLHVPWNLQVLTAEENCIKNNKF